MNNLLGARRRRHRATREVGTGDVVMIPQGIAHLWTPIGNQPFIYVIVKVPAQGSR